MNNSILLLALLLSASSCEKYCTEELILGQRVEIPLDLKNYPEKQAENLYVWNVNNGDTTETFLKDILARRQFTENNSITDNSPEGYYSSDLDGSSLYFLEFTENEGMVLRDSMTQISIKKSRKTIEDECHKDDPNVQIDQLSFMHNGTVKGDGDVVILGR